MPVSHARMEGLVMMKSTAILVTVLPLLGDRTAQFVSQVTSKVNTIQPVTAFAIFSFSFFLTRGKKCPWAL